MGTGNSMLYQLSKNGKQPNFNTLISAETSSSVAAPPGAVTVPAMEFYWMSQLIREKFSSRHRRQGFAKTYQCCWVAWPLISISRLCRKWSIFGPSIAISLSNYWPFHIWRIHFFCERFCFPSTKYQCLRVFGPTLLCKIFYLPKKWFSINILFLAWFCRPMILNSFWSLIIHLQAQLRLHKGYMKDEDPKQQSHPAGQFLENLTESG